MNNTQEISQIKKDKTNKKFKKRYLFVIIPLIFVIFCLIAFNLTLQVTHYHIESGKIDQSFTIALLSDLHASTYGENQRRLVEKIRAGNPDIILFAGDIFHSYGDEEERVPGNTLIRECVKIAPTYFVAGNHERAHWEYRTILQEVGSHGAVVLGNEFIELEINGNTVILAGSSDPHWDGHSYLEEIQQLYGYKIMLTHYPMSYVMYEKYNFDLMLSGHAHGGQARIPFLFPNGLYSPCQGRFPKYTGGLYEINDDFRLIISRGLSKDGVSRFRVFNRPEVVFITVGSS